MVFTEIAQSIEELGALVHGLLSTLQTSIECTFSKVKSILKSTEVEMTGMTDVEDLLLTSFAQVTQEGCEGWVSHSGIYIYIYT